MKTKQITNRILPLLGLAFIVFAILPLVSAAVAMQQPSGGSNISAPTFVTNWTYLNTSSDVINPNSTNTTFYWNGSGSWVQITYTGFNAYATAVNASLSTAGLENGPGVINLTLGNNSVKFQGTLSPSIVIDTVNPTLSFTQSSPTPTLNGLESFTWTSSATSNIWTANFTATPPTIGGGQCAVQNYVTSVGSVTLQGPTLQCAGTWTSTWNVESYSGLNSSQSKTFVVVAPAGPNGNVGAPYASNAVNANSGTNSNPIIIVIIVVIVLYLVFKGK